MSALITADQKNIISRALALAASYVTNAADLRAIIDAMSAVESALAVPEQKPMTVEEIEDTIFRFVFVKTDWKENLTTHEITGIGTAAQVIHSALQPVAGLTPETRETCINVLHEYASHPMTWSHMRQKTYAALAELEARHE